MKYVCVKCRKIKNVYFDINIHDFLEILLLVCGVIPGILFMFWRQQDKQRLFKPVHMCEEWKNGMIPVNHPHKEWFLFMLSPELPYEKEISAETVCIR